MTEKKLKVEDIAGIVKTEEQTDSVELKKEYYKKQSKDKRYKLSMLPSKNIRDGKEPLSQKEVVDRLNEQDERIKELERFKLSIISFAECDENINRRTLNDLIGEIDYD